MAEFRARASPASVANKAVANGRTALDNLSPEELAELREAFRMFDQDGDGSITLAGKWLFLAENIFLDEKNFLEELRVVLDQMGLDPSEEELQDMIREVDEDQSGSVSFEEFVAMVKKAVDTNKTSRKELFRAFQVFDLDQNGFITMEELRTVLQATGDRPTDDEALEMIAEADLDGDGRINYDEFVLIMSSNSNTSSRK